MLVLRSKRFFSEASIQRFPFSLLVARTALVGLRGVRAIVLWSGRGLSYLGRPLQPVRQALHNWIVIPFYHVLFVTDLRIRKTVASTRGIFFLFFTSKYTLHLLLAVVALPMAFIQFQSASAAVETGQGSILYALVTDGQESVVEEGPATSYVGSALLADSVSAEKGIDFGLEPDTEFAFATDYGIEGLLATRDVPTDPTSDNRASGIVVADDTPTPTEPATAEPRTGITTYTIRSGDTLAKIARSFGIDQSTILWENGLTARSTLRVGATLRILPVSGVSHVVKRGETLAQIASKYGVKIAEITAANTLNKTLTVGAELIIPGGKPLPTTPVIATAQKPVKTPTLTPTRTPTTAAKPAETPTRTAKTPKVVGRVAVKSDVPIAKIRNKAFDIYQELANSKEDTRTVPEDKDDSNATKKTKLLWPTRLAVVNQYYGWNHTGLDIDGDYTDPIYASEDGTVTSAGWNSGGYGLQIVVDHPGGLRTRYAHASKLFVKTGEEVKRGQVIGYVGTTGRSTGTHLHYEVYLNGKRQNPLSYTR